MIEIEDRENEEETIENGKYVLTDQKDPFVIRYADRKVSDNCRSAPNN